MHICVCVYMNMQLLKELFFIELLQICQRSFENRGKDLLVYSQLVSLTYIQSLDNTTLSWFL